MAIETIKLREKAYAGYETLANKGSKLTHEETDNNWIGLYQRLYDLMPVGTLIHNISAVATDGWLNCDGQTIGKATSNADYAADIYNKLFVALWNLGRHADAGSGLIAYDNLDAPITLVGSVVSGATAWSSNYYITIPDTRGRFLVDEYLASADTFKPKSFGTGGASTDNLAHVHTATFTGTPVAGHTHGGTVSGTTGSGGAIAGTALSGTSTSAVSITDPYHKHALDFEILEVAEDVAGGKFVYLAQNQSAVVITPGEHDVDTTGILPAPAGFRTGLTDSSSSMLTPNNVPFTTNVTFPAVAAHTHTFSGTVASDGGHTPAGTIAVASAALTADTIPPYYGVHTWIKYSYGLA